MAATWQALACEVDNYVGMVSDHRPKLHDENGEPLQVALYYRTPNCFTLCTIYLQRTLGADGLPSWDVSHVEAAPWQQLQACSAT